MLAGQTPDPALFARAAEAALAGAVPSEGDDWKIDLARRTAAQALAMAAAGTPPGAPALPATRLGAPAGDPVHA